LQEVAAVAATEDSFHLDHQVAQVPEVLILMEQTD
jgi:hypothetical protein